MRLSDIQAQVGQGRYRVDTHAVADAILRQVVGDLSCEPPDAAAQDECS